MEPTTTFTLGDAGLIAGVAGLLLAVVFLVLWRRAVAAPAVAPAEQTADTDADAEALVASVIALADLSTSAAQRRQASRVLATVGVERIEVGEGDAFDSELHAAVDTEETNDANLVGHVASVARDGWMRDGELVRAADVVVWVSGSQAPPRAR